MNARQYLAMQRRASSFAGLGAFDESVLTAQRWLNAQGVTDANGAKLAEDGLLGPRTSEALAKTGWTVAQVAQIAKDMAAGTPAQTAVAKAQSSFITKLTDLVKNKKVWIAVGGLVALLVAMKFLSQPQSQPLAGTTPPRRRRRRK